MEYIDILALELYMPCGRLCYADVNIEEVLYALVDGSHGTVERIHCRSCFAD
jgi:hypothetical protein